MENNVRPTTVMHSFSGRKSVVSPGKALLILVLVTLLGVGSGYVFAKVAGNTGSAPGFSSSMKGETFGSDDISTFKDTAEGKLQEGGIAGEGQYHLERPGGESQNVYLVSSTVDLSQLVGKKVKVWGETQAAQSAGWLMDVGRVEVLE